MAQETQCAKVKIEIKQEVTLERQAFDAQMTIANSLDVGSVDNVDITVKVMDEQGSSVAITTDSNDTSAKFFMRLSSQENISDVSGNGSVAPKATASIHWLLIPAPGAAGDTPLGKRYFIGATLKYKFGGDAQVMDVSPAMVTVRPMPKLALDYFLTKDVLGDDPLTPVIEPTVPFTLGVRVKNTGIATAKNLKIDSAQPKIVDNKQGLLINFRITGSYLNDLAAANTLLVNFGDVAANSSKVGRWVMESSLAGRFTEFSANFSHADELGGRVTSLMQAVNSHLLIRDVRVDLPGRDVIRDFLALDGTTVRVYESEGLDSDVADVSAQSSLTQYTAVDGTSRYRLAAPATMGFLYVKLQDPFRGAKDLGMVVRSDAKQMAAENVWLSKTQNPNTNQWDYWVNVFDANSSGTYDMAYVAPKAAAQAPTIQPVPDKNGRELEQTSFVVQASSGAGLALALTASPLPVGAKFTDSGKGSAIFDWTPAQGQAGTYRITFTASDGSLSASTTATLQIATAAPPPGPATPTIDAPLAGAEVANVKPAFSVIVGTDPRDPTVSVDFEVYADSAMTQLVQKGTGAKSGTTASWTPANILNDNTRFWWRARASDGSGSVYSSWANGQIFVNLFNDPPEPFSLGLPASGGEVSSRTPILSLANTTDKEGDAITYAFYVWSNSALTNLVASVDGLPPGDGGTTSWQVTTPLANHATYWWRAIATDSHGAQTQTPARSFGVYTGNTAPTSPTLMTPAAGARVASNVQALTVSNSSDAENDTLSYGFELDTVATFDSPAVRRSAAIAQGAGATTTWTVSGLVENTRYYWRAKANDGRADSAWTTGSFLMDAQNDPPPVPTIANPGDKSWVATSQPTLLANAVNDPEGDTVSYQFEVFTDAVGTRRIANGSSDSPAWQVPAPLADKTTHYWHVRAVDNLGAASSWSPMTTLYVSSQPYANPSISLISPSTTTDGRSGFTTVQWNGVDPNIDPSIALYFDRTGSGYAGSLIVDGLKQAAGSQQGSYVWNLVGLVPGAYYVYGVIYDAKGMSRAYAPGAVVVPTSPQTGSIIVSPTSGLTTSEDGAVASFNVRLGKVPTKDVVMNITTSDAMRSAVYNGQVVLNSSNWSTWQQVQVLGKTDCIADGNHAYTVTVNSPASLDPDYVGLPGVAVSVTSIDSTQPLHATSDPMLVVCAYGIASRNPASGGGYIYSFFLGLGNLGPPSNGVQLQLMSVPAGLIIQNGTLNFGPVGTGITVKSNSSFSFRSPKLLTLPLSGDGFVWKVISK